MSALARYIAGKAKQKADIAELAADMKRVQQASKDKVQERSEYWLMVVDDSDSLNENCKRHKQTQHAVFSASESRYDVDLTANALNRLDTIKNEHCVVTGETRHKSHVRDNSN